MLMQWQSRMLTGLSALALVLALTDIVMFSSNQKAQNEFSGRTQYIQLKSAARTDLPGHHPFAGGTVGQVQ